MSVNDAKKLADKLFPAFDDDDVAIVDIPYGLYSPITVQEQVDIINTSRRIARRLVIITFEDMDNIIISAGFRILDKCYMTKGNMKREISICE